MIVVCQGEQYYGFAVASRPIPCKATFGEGTTLSQEGKTLRKMHVDVNTKVCRDMLISVLYEAIKMIELRSQDTICSVYTVMNAVRLKYIHPHLPRTQKYQVSKFVVPFSF